MTKCPECGHRFTADVANRWPVGYLKAESEYCAKELEAFYSCPLTHPDKPRCRKELLHKRETFKREWELKQTGK